MMCIPNESRHSRDLFDSSISFLKDGNLIHLPLGVTGVDQGKGLQGLESQPAASANRPVGTFLFLQDGNSRR